MEGECERGLWEVVERWAVLTGAFRKATAAVTGTISLEDAAEREVSMAPSTTTTATEVKEKVGMSTRGLKKRATSLAASVTNSTAGGSAAEKKELLGWESRRRKRHLHLPDAVRKVIKKREQNIKGSRKWCYI
jgi:hypothetical protein